MKLSEWIPDPDAPHAWMRIVAYTDPRVISNRIAFIEKTPRVRIRGYRYSPEINNFCTHVQSQPDIWISGQKGSGELCGKDERSRQWCDSMLILLGYEFTN
jgi:hypothetical protein